MQYMMNLFSFGMPLCEEGEVFRPVPHTGGKYYASSAGRIALVNNGKFRILRQTPGNHSGHLAVPVYPLWFPGAPKSRRVYVHRMVAAAFGLFPPGGENLVVNHIDHNPSNNHVSNLEVITPAQNSHHSALHGRAGGCKLQLADLRVIRRLLREHKSPSHIAERFGVTPETIRRIKKGEIHNNARSFA